MNEEKLKSLLVSDFNIDVLAGYLNNDEGLPNIDAAVAPFGQVIPVLVDENMECWKDDYEFVVVWTQAEGVIESFKDVLDYKDVSVDRILAEVDSFSQMLLNIQNRAKNIFIPTWIVPSYNKGYGMLDMRNEIGMSNILMRMNLRLAENLANAKNIYLLNTQKWIEVVGKNAFNPKLWYMGKIAFGNDVFKEAGRDIKSCLTGISGGAKKLIIVDLDDTLWGGIVGDVGWENIKLGGHDFVGEAFVDFQKSLKALKNRGILLGIVSKNEESVALEAIDNHPEMILRREDFAGWRINWDDKAKNIVELVEELNLGLQSIVFIDDNPAERARVIGIHPQINVPDWPEDKMLYKKTLFELSCFNSPSISQEDVKRAQMYEVEKQRQDLKTTIGSLDEWLENLGIKVEVEELNEGNIQRTTQLLNKTNQMNLTTRRMTENELKCWAEDKNRQVWTFRVSDKFGDSGLTGIASIEVSGTKGKIVDFILSCRVFGRKVEDVMICILIEHARRMQVEEITAEYLLTPKNKPCLNFLEGAGFKNNNNIFLIDVDKGYKRPECVDIKEVIKK